MHISDWSSDVCSSYLGTATGISYVEGVRGMAYQGSAGGQIQFASAGKLAEMTSFSVTFWMNTEKHEGGAQSIFMLPNSEDFWGNLFVIIEGNNSPDDNSMQLKLKYGNNWADFNGSNGMEDRKSVVKGKGVSVGVDLGGRRIHKKKK